MHIAKKSKAQEEKTSDKSSADATTSVWTMDLHSVLLCPKTQASAMYYKTKLTVHNMTYYDLKTKEGFCYVYDETKGDLSADMFAYLHYQHFCKYLEEHPEIRTLIIWSDGCGYQNKSTRIANNFLHLAREKNVVIQQKYLVPGHTQMEYDSMQSVIERKINGDIFIPHDYILAMPMARQIPFPYLVKEILASDCTKLSSEYLKSVRPGKRTGDPTVSDVYNYQYDGTACTASFKLNWDDEWMKLPVRVIADSKIRLPLFERRPKLTARKFADLQSMKSVMPNFAQHFFDNLPHD